MAEKEAAEEVPLFDFVVVRAPNLISPGVLRPNYTHDDTIAITAGWAARVDGGLFSSTGRRRSGPLSTTWYAALQGVTGTGRSPPSPA